MQFPNIDRAVRNNSKYKEAVITSGNDSKHRGSNNPDTDCSTVAKCRATSDSRHYVDDAFDMRGNVFPDNTMRKIAEEINKSLPKGCTAIPEFFSKNPSMDHIHVQCKQTPKCK